MRIAVCEFRQETNSFNPMLCGHDFFVRGGIREGKALFTELEGKRNAITGIRAGIEDSGNEAVPVYSMFSQSAGIVEQSVVDGFIAKLEVMLKELGPFDGVCVSLHGATQSTGAEDVCGLILTAVRRIVGERPVIAASCDLHANITQDEIKAADIICGYHTYPHEDYYETGYRAASLAMRKLAGEPLTAAFVQLPMIVPASGYNTQFGAFRELMLEAEAAVDRGELADFSVFQMQPWLDVSVGGTCCLAIGPDQAKAAEFARALARKLLSLRDTFKPDMFSMDEVIDIAAKNHSDKPVILVDSADSTNAGAAGDNMSVVSRILERNVNVKTACYVDDANVSAQAHRAGVGSRIKVTIGGTKDPERSIPVTVEAYVRSLHDGIFMQEGPAGRGLINNIGPTAVLSFHNIDVVVCHNVSGNGDPQLFRAFGVEPLFYQLVVIKACTSFRAAYQTLAEKICLTNTPGAACADLSAFTFSRVPKSFYPFSDLKGFVPEKVLFARQ